MLRSFFLLVLMWVWATPSYATAVLPEQPSPSAALSDSACSAFVPDKTLLAYIENCATAIDQLSQTLLNCGRLGQIPMSAQQRADANDYCTEFNLHTTRVQLAATRNDLAYFYILKALTPGEEKQRKACLNAALDQLKRAIDLMNGTYWLARKNQAVAYTLLGNFQRANESYKSLRTAMQDTKDAITAGVEPPSPIFVRPTSEAEILLGLGMSELALCNGRAGQESLLAVESLTRGPIAGDSGLNAVAMYGEGLSWLLHASLETPGDPWNDTPCLTKDQKNCIGDYRWTSWEKGWRAIHAAEAQFPEVKNLVTVNYALQSNPIDWVKSCRVKILKAPTS